jgi:biotin carboxyl carrier protein
MKFEVQLEGGGEARKRIVEIERQGGGYRILLDGQLVDADAVQVASHTISILLNGQSFEIHVAETSDGKLKLQAGGHEFIAEVQDPRAWRGRKQGTLEAEGRQQIVAPMPGKVIHLLVKAGDTVQAGQGIAVIEAMKMQNEIRSPKSGKVERVIAKEGQNVSAGEVLAWVE